MIFFPAIDLKGGHCVRLEQGDMERATVFSPDPASQALEFEDAECAWLHVVDLDGAFAGRSINGAAVESVLAATTLRVQLGGGIRDIAGIEAWLKHGVSRVVLGTIALRDPELVKQACKEFPGKVAIGIDGRGGRVAVEGWAETSDVEVRELALMFEDAGAAAIIYTDIERDGVMEGPNVAGIVALAKAITTPVIASGGVSSMDDLRALKEAGEGQLLGVIAGRSVYDGRVDPAEAVKLLGG